MAVYPKNKQSHKQSAQFYLSIHGNVQEKRTNYPQLSATFSSVFESLDEVEWTFEFIRDSLQQLGINEPGDKRLAVTYTSRSSGQAIHVNYCNWLLLGFYKDNENG
ncbi:hypothetical protein [Tepidibacillus fermentans]|uniref:hypothetical protein n=1 Tax=Tepidibacillus fermentans TaxID=1281767 RepID=UPI001048FC1B|nr:hypothetical protein [Tepidibacillus fermentans]